MSDTEPRSVVGARTADENAAEDSAGGVLTAATLLTTLHTAAARLPQEAPPRGVPAGGTRP